MDNSILIVEGEQRTKTIALEGQFFIYFEQNGFQDVVESELIYTNTGEGDPYRDLQIILKKVAVFTCIWENEPGEYYDVKNCKRQLLLEPMKKLNYYQKVTGVINDGPCASITNCVVDIRNIVAIITYPEIVNLLCILGSQMEHLSTSYYKNVKEYYKKTIPKLKNANIFTQKFHYNKSNDIGIMEIAEELKNIMRYHTAENAKVEELRQEYICFNNKRISAANSKSLYKKQLRFESKFLYQFRLEEDIDIILVSKLKGILLPLLHLKISGCSMNCTIHSDKSDIWNLVGYFSVNYYNKVLAAWEPLIEPFDVQYQCERKIDNEITDVTITRSINVNITEELLETLQSYWKLSKAEPNNDYDEENFFNILPKASGRKQLLMKLPHKTSATHAINNQSGEPVVVTTPDQQKFVIPPSKRFNIYTEPSEDIKLYTLLRQVPFRVKVEFDSKFAIQPIIWPSLSSIRPFSCKYGKDSYQFTDAIENHQKVLTISTSYQLVNKLEIPLLITFYPTKGVPRTYFLFESTATLSIAMSLINVPAIFSLRKLHKREGSEFIFAGLREKLAVSKFLQMNIEKDYSVILILNPESNGDIVEVCVWAHLWIQNCLPVPLSINFLEGGVNATLESMNNTFVHNIVIPHEGKFEISIPNFKKQLINYNLSKKKNLLILYDKNMHEIHINMQILQNRKALHSMIFYADYVIKNLTQDNLIFYATTKTSSKPKIIAGQSIGKDKVTLLNKSKTLVICLDSINNTVALNIKKYNAQVNFSISYTRDGQTYCSDYVLLTKLKELIPDTSIKTYFYQIYNQFIFANNTTALIKVFQAKTQNYPLTVKPGSSSPFYWLNDRNPVSVFICFESGSITESFKLHELGSIVQQLIQPNRKPGKIIRIERYIDKGVQFIKIKEEPKDHPYYVLQNESSYITVEYKEKNYESQEYQYLDSTSRVALGWVYPQKPHMVSLRFLWNGMNKRPVLISETPYSFSMDTIVRYSPITLSIHPGHKKYLWVALESDEDSKILCIRDMVKKYDPCESHISQSINVTIGNLGISLISFYFERRTEILYMSLQEIIFSIIKGEIEKEIELVVKDIQIDNQMKKEPIFPILLSKKVTEKVNERFLTIHTMSNLLIEPKENFYSFDLIQINVAPLVVSLEEDCVIAITDFFDRIKGTSIEKEDKLLSAEDDGGESETGISVENLRISDIKFDVSFRSSMDMKTTDNLVTKSLAAAFINLKELPITLRKIGLFNVYGKLKTILLMLLQNYKIALESKKLGIIAGMMFSPFTDVNHIGIGLTNFFNNPMEGPTGIMTGTGSLFKGAVAGTFGTVSGVASTVSQGILALSADEEYIKERQKNDKLYRPQNVLEGIGLGLVSTFMSVGSGIAGVITKPIEGASKEGVKGLFKGVGKGLAGVVTKPISGGLDLVSKTTEGIKNTTMLFDKKLKEIGRTREIRAFYGYKRLIKNYCSLQTVVLSYVQSLDKGKYERDHFLDLYFDRDIKNKARILFLSEEHIASIYERQTLWIIPTNSLRKVEIVGKILRVHYATRGETAYVTFAMNDSNSIVKLYEKLIQLIET